MPDGDEGHADLGQPGDDELDGDCRDAVHRLYHYLDGELTTERRDVIRHHLDACSDCVEAYEFEAELRLAISRGCSESVPDSLRRRVASAIAHENPPLSTR